jgi:hypothetical protein
MVAVALDHPGAIERKILMLIEMRADIALPEVIRLPLAINRLIIPYGDHLNLISIGSGNWR